MFACHSPLAGDICIVAELTPTGMGGVNLLRWLARDGRIRGRGISEFQGVLRRSRLNGNSRDSLAARGRPLPPNVHPPRLWEGVSVYDSQERARRTVQARTYIGRYIARLDVSDEVPIVFERTTGSPGHFTLWGEPALILTCVTEIVPV